MKIKQFRYGADNLSYLIYGENNAVAIDGGAVADIVDFTGLSSGADPVEVVRLLNDVFSEFDELAEMHGLEKIKTIGDSYMAAAGLPIAQLDHVDRAVLMGLEVVDVVATLFSPDFYPESVLPTGALMVVAIFTMAGLMLIAGLEDWNSVANIGIFLSYGVVVPWIRQGPGSWPLTSVIANIILMFLVTPEISGEILI